MGYSDDELDELAGLVKAKSGPKPKKKVKKKAKRVVKLPVKLGADGSGQVNLEPIRGLPTKVERSKDLAVRLEKENFDPIEYMLGLMRDSDDDSITDLERAKMAKDLLTYMYQKQKSVETKETKDFTINIVKRNFALDDDGKVIDV